MAHARARLPLRERQESSRYPPEALYQGFTDPVALAMWLSPGDMTGKVHEFEGRVGGGYRMSLFYPPSELRCL